MPTRFSVVVDDDQARDIEQLAREHDLTDEEVLRQLLALGLDTLDGDRPVEGPTSHDAPGKTDADP
ncbi:MULTISPECIES: hypothetical protein [unclassified Halorhabdus]|uniref:hypothetical protein n=1 Tax=unclassified Halorhabdus TaxID=2621901 RepID=UPI0023DC4100|nr:MULTISPECIES: hypothetical protein [unclassified Halorhabdus]WEL18057.1 Ribbon-helix-helix protein, copG family [Halorhabdus sp. SVX81]WEL21939.1 Ribbon-helix-helix protein, copG family [Halorhabdus sp. BNX81]